MNTEPSRSSAPPDVNLDTNQQASMKASGPAMMATSFHKIGVIEGASVSMISLRILVALMAPFPVYMGFNEAYYALVSRTYTDWTPRQFGHPFYDTPPLLTYLGWLATHILSFRGGIIVEGVYRIPSIAAYIGLAYVFWKLKGREGLALAAFTPWVWFWMTKNQTDPLLTVFVCLFAYLGVKGTTGWTVVATTCLGFLSKQTFLLAIPMLFNWPKETRFKAGIQAALGLVLASLWWVGQYVGHPAEVLHAWLWNASSRATPLGDAAEILILGVTVGSAGLYALVPSRISPTFVTAWVFVGFAVVEAPINHAYYTLPGVALLAMAAPMFRDWPTTMKRVVPVGMALGIVFMVFLGGELDGRVIQHGLASMPVGASVQSQIWPQAWFYGHPTNGTVGCQGSAERLCSWQLRECSTEQSFGPRWDRLFLLECPQTGS